jgi:glutaredoxin
MIVKIFWQNECSRCPQAKELGKELEENGVKVEYHDVKNLDGLAEATYFNVLSTPSIIVVDDDQKEVNGWRGETPEIKDVKKFLN